jgi:hypothetical protein
MSNRAGVIDAAGIFQWLKRDGAVYEQTGSPLFNWAELFRNPEYGLGPVLDRKFLH